ncbi:MAG: hypothetical protein ACNA71_01635 [Kiritimatiellia bacterium]
MILVAVATEAKVYLRWGAAGNLARFVAGIGGKLAYQSEMTVNGSKANISVYGLPESNRNWVNTVSSLSYHAGDAFTSLTGITLSGTPVLFQYQRQTADNAAPHSAAQLPRFPQSTQAFHAHNKNTDMYISILRSSSSANEISAFYRAAMQADGWHIPIDDTETTPDGMTIFIREQEVACLALEQLNQQNETRITLLHKHLKIK